jgi:hypothetical protein
MAAARDSREPTGAIISKSFIFILLSDYHLNVIGGYKGTN